MEKIIVYNYPTGSVTEAYRVLCANLLAGLGKKKVLEISGISIDSTSSYVTANIAVAMAQAGKKVLLIDCNLREPKQQELFGLQNRGITDYIVKGEDYKAFVQNTGQSNLFLLAAGAVVPDNPVELLLNEPVQKVFDKAKEIYDIVLLDVPSVETGAEAVALGPKTDGVVIVVTNKQDKVEQVQKAKYMFLNAGVNVLGCILDKA